MSLLQEILDALKIKAIVVDEIIGSRNITYEIRPNTGTKMSQIKFRLPEIASGLGVENVRLTSRADYHAYGIEVPRNEIDVVRIADLLQTHDFRNSDTKLTIGIGKNVNGKAIVGGLEKMPHLLIGGEVKTGISVFLNSLVNCLLYTHSPTDLRFLMIDPMLVELFYYEGIPHLLAPVITESKKAFAALRWAVSEMERRYAALAQIANKHDIIIRDIGDVQRCFRIHHMPHIVIIIDELADLMTASFDEAEESIIRIAQKGRASGMHMILATQRPEINAVSDLMNANISSKIAFKTSCEADSQIILGVTGAESLVGNGDMLYYPEWELHPMRVQSAFISDIEIVKMVNYIKSNNKEVFYDNSLTAALRDISA